MHYIAYTDGSYMDVPGYGAFYSSAATLTKEGDAKPFATLTKVANDELISMRNVAGEIMAVMMVLEHCLNALDLKENDSVTIYHDYAGIANWCKRKGEKDYWRCKNAVTQGYRDYINTIVRPRFKLEFIHTKGHTGVTGNEYVDMLAKDAIKNHVQNLKMEH